MSSITDKELLTICNLVNGLKLEFAQLKNEDATDPNAPNHTIYSLLIQERDGILDQAVKNRAFFNLVNDQTLDVKETALYNSVAELKKAAGMAYEYVEKFDLGNTEGAFTDQWEIVFAADSYKLLLHFLDNHFNRNKYIIKYKLNNNDDSYKLNSIIHQKFRRK